MSSALTQKILIPVDGSDLAERIVQLVRRLGKGGGEVKVVRVVPDSKVNEALKGKDVFGAAKGYLELIVHKLREAGVTSSSALMVGDPAEEILKLAESFRPTLVAMSTHGRTGVERWIRGSVAERVLRECRFPLLLANPFALEESKKSKSKGFRRILVPLDGSARAAEVLPLVREIAQSSSAEIVLFESTAKPGATQTTDDVLRSHAEAREELEAIGNELEGATWRVVTTSRPPATAIASAIKREGIDLVAMTTHGRTGLSRWVFGSVAENVIRECRCPLLLLRSSGLEKGKAVAPSKAARKKQVASSRR